MKFTRRNFLVFTIGGAVLIGLAVLLAPTVRKSAAGGRTSREFAAFFYDPLLPAPELLAARTAEHEGLSAMVKKSAEGLGISLGGEPEFHFDAERSMVSLRLIAGSDEKIEAFVSEAFKIFAQAYSAHPIRRQALEAALKLRDAGLIRLLAAPEIDAASIPALISPLGEIAKARSPGLSAVFLPVSLAALAGLFAVLALYSRKTQTS